MDIFYLLISKQLWPVLLAAVLLSGLISFLVMRRQLKKIEKKFESNLKVHAQNMAIIEQANFGIGRHLHLIEKTVKEFGLRHEELEYKDSFENNYSQAAQLAGMGATASDLMCSFGLSHIEAELIEKLHSGRSSSPLH